MPEFQSIPNDQTNPRKSPRGAHYCNAKNDTCKGNAMRGSTKCLNHGGASPRGAASPHFKHGRRSKHMPAHLKSRYFEIFKDPEILSARSTIAFLECRIDELMGKLDGGGDGTLWATMREKVIEMRTAIEAGNEEECRAVLAVMDDLTAKGASQEEIWNDIFDKSEKVSKITQREWKRQVEQGRVIAADEAMTLIAAIMGCVKNHVVGLGRRLENLERAHNERAEEWPALVANVGKSVLTDISRDVTGLLAFQRKQV